MSKGNLLLKIFTLAFFLNVLEDLILLLFFNVRITLGVIIGTFIFSIILIFLLKQFKLVK